ncbi:hypothetical protein KC352_g36124, partial [Hortaea werneckii]
MAKSPKEEESRASAVGRKRKQQPAGNWQNTNGTASQNKRLKHGNRHAKDSDHEPSDYIPLDAAEPRRSLRLRNRRDSKESGEVSTSASSSRRTSRESGEIGAGSTSGSSVDRASKPSTTSADNQNAPKHGASGTRGTIPTGPIPSRMSLEDIAIPTFRIQLRKDVKEHPGVPIEELIKRYAEDGKDFYKTAKRIIREKKQKFPGLQVDANQANRSSPKVSNGITNEREAKDRLGSIYRDTSNFTRRMTKNDKNGGEDASESETSDDDTDAEDDSSDGDPVGSHYNDYGAFAREAAASDSTDKYDGGIRLYEASEEQQELQHRYFHIEGTAAH